MATVAANPSAVLGEAVLGWMELGAPTYREQGHITIVNQRQARVKVANIAQADITIASERQAQIMIESE